MTRVTNIAFIRAQQGKSGQLGQWLLGLVEPSRSEPGCVNYDVHRSDTDENLWCVYENWRSSEDLKLHFSLPHMQAFVAELPKLVAGELDLRAYSMMSTPAPWRL